MLSPSNGIWTTGGGAVAPSKDCRHASRVAAPLGPVSAVRRQTALTGPSGAATREAWRQSLLGATAPPPVVQIPLDGDSIATLHDGTPFQPRTSEGPGWLDDFPGAAAQING